MGRKKNYKELIVGNFAKLGRNVLGNFAPQDTRKIKILVCRALVGVGAMAPPLFENMLIGTHTFMGELNEL